MGPMLCDMLWRVDMEIPITNALIVISVSSDSECIKTTPENTMALKIDVPKEFSSQIGLNVAINDRTVLKNNLI